MYVAGSGQLYVAGYKVRCGMTSRVVADVRCGRRRGEKCDVMRVVDLSAWWGGERRDMGKHMKGLFVCVGYVVGRVKLVRLNRKQLMV